MCKLRYTKPLIPLRLAHRRMHKQFLPLSCIDSDSNKSTNSSIPGNTHIGSPGPPLLRSSAIQPSTCKPNTRPLNILSVNLQSFPAKKEVFWEAVDVCAPDIVTLVKSCHLASIP